MNPEHLFCTLGEHFAPFEQFSKAKHGKYGRGRWCHECRADYEALRLARKRAWSISQKLRWPAPGRVG